MNINLCFNQKKITFILIIILLICAFPEINSEDFDYNSSIIIGPYPQNVELNSSIIVWETSIETTINSVQYGLNQNCEFIVYNNVSNNFHTVKLYGLNSSTKYYYKVT